MVEITLDNIVPSTPSDDGWKVEYRVKGSTGAYLVPIGSPFNSFPIIFTTNDSVGTLYEGHIWNDCGAVESIKFNWETPCDCTDGTYSPNANETKCKKVDSIAPTITHSGYCLIESKNTIYSLYGSRIYNLGFNLSTILLAPATSNTYIYGSMTLSPQWCNPSGIIFAGPLNREGVWVDSDCDSNIDSITNGQEVTIATQFNNIEAARTIYIGVSGNKQFKLVVNGTVIIDTLSTVDTIQYKMWHIVPVTIDPGVNYVSLVGVSDGTINDAIGMAIYDNTAAQIHAATTDSALNILFKSSNLRGTTYDIATCPSNYTLDTSDGPDNYICTRVLKMPCNTAP